MTPILLGALMFLAIEVVIAVLVAMFILAAIWFANWCMTYDL